MTQAEIDQLPRVFQANIARFHERIVLATLAQLPDHGALKAGETTSLDVFLDRAAAQVDNHTANEAAKAFALILDGLFERQLNRWAHAHGLATSPQGPTLRTLCADHAGLDLVQIGIAADLKELHLLANVVRHGEGHSCDRLKAAAPHLWDNIDDLIELAPGPVPDSERYRVRESDLRRYAGAILRFWGHLDPLSFADRYPPH